MRLQKQALHNGKAPQTVAAHESWTIRSAPRIERPKGLVYKVSDTVCSEHVGQASAMDSVYYMLSVDHQGGHGTLIGPQQIQDSPVFQRPTYDRSAQIVASPTGTKASPVPVCSTQEGRTSTGYHHLERTGTATASR